MSHRKKLLRNWLCQMVIGLFSPTLRLETLADMKIGSPIVYWPFDGLSLNPKYCLVGFPCLEPVKAAEARSFALPSLVLNRCGASALICLSSQIFRAPTWMEQLMVSSSLFMIVFHTKISGGVWAMWTQ